MSGTPGALGPADHSGQATQASPSRADGGQGHRNNEPRRDGVAKNETKKAANAATNESAATGNSTEAADGESMTSVIETTTPITKANATRSPFCRGLN